MFCPDTLVYIGLMLTCKLVMSQVVMWQQRVGVLGRVSGDEMDLRVIGGE